jgi:predicted DNA-binding ribbon-helix-helix protein
MPREKKRQNQPHWIDIGDRLTSVRIEPEFLFWARQLAAEQGLTFKAFIVAIAKAKDPQVSLSSAIRVYVARYLHDHLLPAKPGSRKPRRAVAFQAEA